MAIAGAWFQGRAAGKVKLPLAPEPIAAARSLHRRLTVRARTRHNAPA
jgi:hypothetical protein